MAENILSEILNDCIDRLAAGESVEDCLRRYPQYAAELHPMLETGLLARRAIYGPREVGPAHARVRERITHAIETQRKVRHYPFRGLATLAASFLIVFAAIFVVLSARAEGSLPGDTLYGLKRFNEGARLFFSGDDDSLQDQFNQRRIEEIEALLEQGRAADVEFEGELQAMNDTTWQVAGLAVQIADETIGIEAVQVGDQIRIEGHTTPQRELVADTITPSEAPQQIPTPTIVPSPTPTLIETPTPSPTITTTPTVTSTPTPTVTPTLTITSSPTLSPPPTGIGPGASTNPPSTPDEDNEDSGDDSGSGEDDSDDSDDSEDDDSSDDSDDDEPDEPEDESD